MSALVGQEVAVSPTTDQERAFLSAAPQQAIVVNVCDDFGRVWVRTVRGGETFAVQPASVEETKG